MRPSSRPFGCAVPAPWRRGSILLPFRLPPPGAKAARASPGRRLVPAARGPAGLNAQRGSDAKAAPAAGRARMGTLTGTVIWPAPAPPKGPPALAGLGRSPRPASKRGRRQRALTRRRANPNSSRNSADRWFCPTIIITQLRSMLLQDAFSQGAANCTILHILPEVAQTCDGHAMCTSVAFSLGGSCSLRFLPAHRCFIGAEIRRPRQGSGFRAFGIAHAPSDLSQRGCGTQLCCC